VSSSQRLQGEKRQRRTHADDENAAQKGCGSGGDRAWWGQRMRAARGGRTRRGVEKKGRLGATRPMARGPPRRRRADGSWARASQGSRREAGVQKEIGDGVGALKAIRRTEGGRGRTKGWRKTELTMAAKKKFLPSEAVSRLHRWAQTMIRKGGATSAPH